MIKDLVIATQYRENYGAHSWDGQGDCPQHWKNKGGEEIIVTDVPVDVILQDIVDSLRGEFEWSTDYSQQYFVGFGLQEPGYKTEFERSQEEFEGSISYPAHRIAFSDLKLEV